MKNKIFKFLLIFFSVLFSLFIVEIFLIIDDYRPAYKNFSYSLLNNKIKINHDISDIEKENNSIFFGDSFTYSEVCFSQKKDFISLIEKQKKKPMINLGFNGGNPIQYSYFLNQLNLKSQKTKKIVIVLYYNDIPINRKTCFFYNELKDEILFYPKKCDLILKESIDSENDNLIKKIDNFFETKFKIWLLFKESIANLPVINKIYNRVAWENYYQNIETEEFKAFISDLKYLKNKIEINKIKSLFIFFPDVNHIDPDNHRNRVVSNFIKLAAIYGIDILNPWQDFLEKSSKKNLT